MSNYTLPTKSSLDNDDNSKFILPIITEKSSMKHNSRVILDDRKGFLDHLKPRPILFSTIRITLFQAMMNVTSYFTDQIEYEQRNDDLVNQGQLKAIQAQQFNDEWEEREWVQRWKYDFPYKVGTALGKYHAMILCMRFYETILCEKLLQMDKISLDQFTLDLFKYSLRRRDDLFIQDKRITVQDKQYKNATTEDSRWKSYIQEDDMGMIDLSSYDSSSLSSSSSIHKVDSFSEIVKTCLKANFIAFVADCTVQQLILFYMYGRYWWRKQQRIHRLEEEEEEVKKGDDSDCKEDEDKKIDLQKKEQNVLILSSESLESGLLLSFFLKSMKFIVSRGMGLLCSSFGGAVGCVLYPGYGILFGTQLGDAVSGSLIDSS